MMYCNPFKLYLGGVSSLIFKVPILLFWGLIFQRPSFAHTVMEVLSARICTVDPFRSCRKAPQARQTAQSSSTLTWSKDSFQEHKWRAMRENWEVVGAALPFMSCGEAWGYKGCRCSPSRQYWWKDSSLVCVHSAIYTDKHLKKSLIS